MIYTGNVWWWCPPPGISLWFLYLFCAVPINPGGNRATAPHTVRRVLHAHAPELARGSPTPYRISGGCVLNLKRGAGLLRNVALDSMARQQLDHYRLFQQQQQA